MEKISLKTLSNAIVCYKQCKDEYKDVHLITIEQANKDLPHGSGLDGKLEVDIESSEKNKIIIFLEFHHMDENGYYDGWSYHNLVITPEFDGFKLRITGKDKNGIKEYLYQLFYEIFE